MNIYLHSFLAQNDEYELTVLGDEVILFSALNEKAIYLNHTAQLIWRLCDGSTPVYELVTVLEKRYADEKNIDQQVITALNQMFEDDVVKISDQPHLQ